MKLRFSVLNFCAAIFLLGCFVFTLIKYKKLSEGEGWGVIGMIGLMVVGVALLVIDIIIQWLFKNKRTANIIGAIIALVATVLIAFGGIPPF